MSARTTKPAGPSGKRRRTRSAIVAAAAELLARGATPSVAEVAEAAEVSRRTVYMYFPTLEQLLIDATLETIARKTAGSPDRSADRDGDSDDDVEVRVERMARWVQRMSADTEHHAP